jgi:hypothetical protein
LGGKWFFFIFPWFMQFMQWKHPNGKHSCEYCNLLYDSTTNFFWPLTWLDDTSFLFHKVLELWYKIVQHLQHKFFNSTRTCFTITNTLCTLSRFSFFSKIYLLTMGLLIACQIKRQGPYSFNN